MPTRNGRFAYAAATADINALMQERTQLYRKADARAAVQGVATRHRDRGWPVLSNGYRDAVEYRGFAVRKTDLGAREPETRFTWTWLESTTSNGRQRREKCAYLYHDIVDVFCLPWHRRLPC